MTQRACVAHLLRVPIDDQYVLRSSLRLVTLKKVHYEQIDRIVVLITALDLGDGRMSKLVSGVMRIP
jgi:hypothetical protein